MRSNLTKELIVNLKGMQELAIELATAAESGVVFALQGPLGSGKTTFARFFIQYLCGLDVVVNSPTFTLVQIYDTDKGPLWHMDLYRLRTPDEVHEIGVNQALYDSICLIEWPDMINLSENHYRLHFEIINPEQRRVTINYGMQKQVDA